MRKINPKPILILVLVSCFLTSCITRQYFLSPFQATNQPYRAMPLISDSTKSATYAGGVLAVGGANQGLRDQTFQFQGEIHRAHVINNNFHFNYGATGLLGSYTVKLNAGNYTYGVAPFAGQFGDGMFVAGAGVFAGAYYTIPLDWGGEWRVIGLESNFQKEFGEYGKMRKLLPDSLAEGIQRPDYFNTIGITTNLIRKFRKSKNKFGYRAGIFISTTQVRDTKTMYAYNVIPAYVVNTVHFTKRRVTGYAQVNIGTYAANFMIGGSVRIGKY
ncbi:MAG: hypothetical protein EOO02_05230 [Chitinophagaceae bacterium]|nr:MAG: hypothetical protein EOO02_05230 [Chitinophagaceae bacterium]